MIKKRMLHIICIFSSILFFEWNAFPFERSTHRVYYTEEYEKLLLQAIDNLFDRNYTEAGENFKELERLDPSSPIAKFGESALYQLRMVEEDTFAFEKEYRKSAEAAQKIIEKKIGQKKANAWLYLIAGASYGLDGLLAAQKRDWWNVIKKGYTGLTYIQKAKELDPELYDADLGIGLYEYFRSKLSEKFPFLPFYSNVKDQGIKRIKDAIGKARFTEYASYVCLCFMYIVEKDADSLLFYSGKIEQKYPRNLMARIFKARGFRDKEKYAEAEKTLQKALELHKDYAVAHLHLAYVYQLQMTKKNALADQALSHYIRATKASKSKHIQANAYYNMGSIYAYQKKDARAEFYREKARKLNPDLSKKSKKKVKTFGV